MPTSPLLRTLALAVLVMLGALAAAPRQAGAATYVNATERTCWARPAPLPVRTSVMTIIANNTATLSWTSDGELSLLRTNALSSRVWSAGTRDRGALLCFEPNGSLVIYSAAGIAIWSASGASPPTTGALPGTLRARLRLQGCTLSSRYEVTWDGLGTIAAGELWRRESSCPKLSASLTASGWCMDNTQERTIVVSQWAELAWKPGGFMVHRGIGSAAGREYWHTPTVGNGVKLCFEDTGRLVIYDSIERPIWTSNAPGPTTSSYLLGLERCSLEIASAAGGETAWNIKKRCLQAEAELGKSIVVGPEPVTFLENDDAKLVLDPSGNLALRTRGGETLWGTRFGAGLGYRLSLLTTGDLAIFDRNGRAVWSANAGGLDIFQLALDRCELTFYSGNAVAPTVVERLGAPSCDRAALTNAPAWSRRALGRLVLTRSAEASLVWQADGNLVLYTNGGTAIWASNTNGQGRRLEFQADGNLVVYGATGALWASGTASSAPLTLSIKDRCTLGITEGSTSRWTGTTSCAVLNYSFERKDGNDTFGTLMQTSLVAEDSGAARLDSATSVAAAIFGYDYELFSATAYQTELDDGSSLSTGSVTVFGESAVAANITYEKTFFEKEKTFMVGIVPVVVTAGASGEVGLSLAFASGTLSLTPAVALSATVEAGVGVGSDVAGASAGIRGTLVLIEVSLPISLKIVIDSAGSPSFNVTGDLTLASLAGSIALYAKAFVKLWLVEVSVEWSRDIFAWSGVEWSKNLFTKSGRF